jgi:hypothetical protein
MSGQVADAVAPFCRRLGAGGAVPARTELSLAAASTALFHDLLANPAFISTSLGRHEGTFYSGFNTSASHWNHPPFSLDSEINKKKPDLPLSGLLTI